MSQITKLCPKCSSELVDDYAPKTATWILLCENCGYSEPYSMDQQLRRQGATPLPGFE